MSNLLCLVCSKSFPAAELSGHVASAHLGFLPFACTCCDFAAAREVEVLQHAEQEGHIQFAADRSHVKPYLGILTGLIVGHCQTFAETKNFTDFLSGLTSQIAANKSGLSVAKCEAQPEENRDADASSERSSSTLRSALVANSQTINSPVSTIENSSCDCSEARPAYQNSSAIGMAPQNEVTPKVDAWEDPDTNKTALAQAAPDPEQPAAEMCALCASNEEFHAGQKEAHVMRHLERSSASANQNPAIFFATIAEMWQRCFPSQTPPSDDVAMETKNDVSPRSHVNKKPKHLKGQVVCTLCDKHVKMIGRQEHVWNEHMDGADRFCCGSCGNKGVAKRALKQACADLHPDIPADIKPLVMSVQLHARQYFACFGAYPGAGGIPTRSSVSTTPASTELAHAALPTLSSPPLGNTRRRCSSRRLSHTKSTVVEPPPLASAEEKTIRAPQKLPLRTSKKGKSVSSQSARASVKKDDLSVNATIGLSDVCQICQARITSSSSRNNFRRDLRAHAMALHFDGPQKIYECSACGYGENIWPYRLIDHVKKQHATEKDARVIDRRAKYAVRIERCFDSCFPNTERRKNGPRAVSVKAVKNVNRETEHAPGAEKPGAKMSRLRVAIAKKTKSRISVKPAKRAAGAISAAAPGARCHVCGVHIKRHRHLLQHALRAHFQQQHPQKIYECSKCGFGDNTWPCFVTNHVKQIHPGDKSVRVINRHAKLTAKIQECLDVCFPGSGLRASRNVSSLAAAPSEEDSSESMLDQPGTCGYAAIGLDTSDNQLDFHGFECESDMPLVAIKDEQISGAVHTVSYVSTLIAENGDILKMETVDD